MDLITNAVSGMGVDYELDMVTLNTDSSATVFDTLGNPTGTVKVTVDGKRVTIRVPLALLGGDDGFLNAAAVVGTRIEPTDIAPNGGHLKLGGTGPVAPYMPAASTRRPNVQPVIPLPWKRTQ